MREKPPHVNEKAWKVFDAMADEEGYGVETDDWDAWWEAFYAGFKTGFVEGIHGGKIEDIEETKGEKANDN